jgi:hypothetical protein
MASIYFAGYLGGFNLVDLPEKLFKVHKWNFVKDKDLVDISNTNALGTQQFISNLNAGTIKATGYMTDDLLEAINNFDIEIGSEVKFNLYFDQEESLGFTDIDCVIDDINFTMDIQSVGNFTISAVISEPKP